MEQRQGGRTAFRVWAAAVAAVVFAGGFVPYRLLAGSAAALDVFGFWLAFGLVVIALIGLAVARWKD
jgi:hypothetical protein